MNTLYADRGQGLVEYALILVFVAVIVLIALQVLGPTVGTMFTNVNTELERVTSFLLQVI